MPSQEELIKEVEAHFEAENYNEIIHLLSDSYLKEENNPILYVWKARSYGRLEHYENAYKMADNAIQIDPNFYLAYYVKAKALSETKRYDTAILNYNKAIELKNDFIDAYNNRASAWAAKGEHKKAIEDLDKAIEIKDDLAILYYNRGNAWHDLREYDKAIENYSKAIELKNDYATAYGNRGESLGRKMDYHKAIEDFTKAISIQDNYALAYLGRGNMWYYISKYKNAIEDYSKAIALSKVPSGAYYNRGLTLENINKYEEAITDYEKALEFDSSFALARNRLDKLLAKLGRVLSTTSNTATPDDTLYKIKECTKGIDDQSSIMQFFVKNLNPIIDRIRKLAENIDNAFTTHSGLKGRYVAHYTNLKIADIILMKDETINGGPKLRYSNAVFMNDPDEGKILIESLDNLEQKDDQTTFIKTAFDNVLKEETNNFYLGSFLPAVDGHEDELLMWRTYGKDDLQNEAAGCCLLIDVSFFDKSDNRGIALAREEEISSAILHPLYRVLYYNQRQNKFEGDDDINGEIIKLKYELLALLNKKKQGASQEIEQHNRAIEKVLYHTLSELRYFFKSSDYAYESELRTIQFASHKDTVKIDKESGLLPRKLYIESTKGVKSYIKKIVLGPKVQHPNRWIYLQKKMEDDGHSLEMIFSNCHFQ